MHRVEFLPAKAIVNIAGKANVVQHVYEKALASGIVEWLLQRIIKRFLMPLKRLTVK